MARPRWHQKPRKVDGLLSAQSMTLITIIVIGQLQSNLVQCTPDLGVKFASKAVDHPESLLVDYSLPQDKSDIAVNIRIFPAKFLHGKVYLSTNQNITAVAEIVDEKFKNQSIIYQWSTKNQTIITSPNVSQITHHFDEPTESDFLKVLVIHKPNNTGVNQKDLVIRNPISISDPAGKLFLDRGELLNISLEVKGTGPYGFCYRFCLQSSRECDQCEHPKLYTNSSRIHIVHYLRYVGNHTLLFEADNVATSVKKQYSVRIFEASRHQTVPIVPIACSISAVLILVIGLVLHSKFNQQLPTETADFDFTGHRELEEEEDELWGDEQTFIERVKCYVWGRGRFDPDSAEASISSVLSGSQTPLV